MVTPLDELLAKMVEVGASDLHLKVGSPPVVRIAGDLHPTKLPALLPDDTITYAESIFTPKASATFRATSEANFAYGRREFGRFRVNVFRQRGSVGVVMRRVLHDLPSFEELGLPPALGHLRTEKSGLVIVAGPASSGKTTTIASMIDYINRTRAVNIVTFEDPIEVVHADQMSIVSQREIGMDTESYATALENVLRQDPDVIVIDRMNDAATVRAVLAAAEMGHLVFACMSTIDAVETITRILDFFPEHLQKPIRSQLAGQMLAVVCQRLLERVDGEGMVPAVEYLQRNEELSAVIVRAKRPSRLVEIMERPDSNMQTYDQSIASLYTSGLISYETASAALVDGAMLRRIPEADARLAEPVKVVEPTVPEPVPMTSPALELVQEPEHEPISEQNHEPDHEPVADEEPEHEAEPEPVDEQETEHEPVAEPVAVDEPEPEHEADHQYEPVAAPDLSALPPPPPMFTPVGVASSD